MYALSAKDNEKLQQVFEILFVGGFVHYKAVADNNYGVTAEYAADVVAHVASRRLTGLQRGNLDDFVVVQSNFYLVDDIVRQVAFADNHGRFECICKSLKLAALFGCYHKISLVDEKIVYIFLVVAVCVAMYHHTKNACWLASLRALLFLVCCLPSRALVQMFSIGDTSPPTTFKFVSKQSVMCRLFQSAFPAECAIVRLIRRYVMENYHSLLISNYVVLDKIELIFAFYNSLLLN